MSLATASETIAAPVAWAAGGASATFDQNFAGGVAAAIDGNPSSSGWAVFGGQFADQAAMFTAAAPVNAPNLFFNSISSRGFEAHNINEFRISVTQDAAPSFGGAWTHLPLANVDSSSKFTLFEDVGDNRVRAAPMSRRRNVQRHGRRAVRRDHGVSAWKPSLTITTSPTAWPPRSATPSTATSCSRNSSSTTPCRRRRLSTTPSNE